MSNTEEWLPTEKIVEDYKLYSKMLEALATEVRELSKKKQEGVLNLTKVRMINRILKPLKEDILAHVPANIFLDLLDEDVIPNNSDAVLVISQYEAAINEFSREYYRSFKDDSYYEHNYWATVENPDGQAGYDDEDEEEDDNNDGAMPPLQ